MEIRELEPSGPKVFGLGLACDRIGTPAERDRRMRCQGDVIRNIVATLGAGDDRATVTGLPTPVRLDGGLGSDNLRGGDGDDALIGGGGPVAVTDFLHGGEGRDALAPGEGNSSINADGGEGDDTLTGGQRGDTLLAGPGSDDVSGNDGNDVIDGGDDEDVVRGGPGDDTLVSRPSGGDFIGDKVSGNDGNDVLQLVGGTRGPRVSGGPRRAMRRDPEGGGRAGTSRAAVDRPRPGRLLGAGGGTGDGPRPAHGTREGRPSQVTPAAGDIRRARERARAEDGVGDGGDAAVRTSAAGRGACPGPPVMRSSGCRSRRSRARPSRCRSDADARSSGPCRG